MLFGPERDRNIHRVVTVDLGPHHVRAIPISKDKGPVATPVRYGFRSFDRQWIIPDHRLLSRARPKLWGLISGRQIFLTALQAHSPSAGPAITFTCLVPDQHHYKGSFGGRVYPLWTDAQAAQSNVRADVLQTLAKAHGAAVSAEDLVAYIAAVMANPALPRAFAPISCGRVCAFP